MQIIDGNSSHRLQIAAHHIGTKGLVHSMFDCCCCGGGSAAAVDDCDSGTSGRVHDDCWHVDASTLVLGMHDCHTATKRLVHSARVLGVHDFHTTAKRLVHGGSGVHDWHINTSSTVCQQVLALRNERRVVAILLRFGGHHTRQRIPVGHAERRHFRCAGRLDELRPIRILPSYRSPQICIHRDGSVVHVDKSVGE